MSQVPEIYWEDVEVYRLTGLTTKDRWFVPSRQIADTLIGIRAHYQDSTTPVQSSLDQLDSNVRRMREWVPEEYIETLWKRGCCLADTYFPPFVVWRPNDWTDPSGWVRWTSHWTITFAPDPGECSTALYPPYTEPAPEPVRPMGVPQAETSVTASALPGISLGTLDDSLTALEVSVETLGDRLTAVEDTLAALARALGGKP